MTPQEEIRFFRKKLNYTQEKLSLLLGYNRTYVGSLENNKAKLPRSIYALLKILDQLEEAGFDSKKTLETATLQKKDSE